MHSRCPIFGRRAGAAVVLLLGLIDIRGAAAAPFGPVAASPPIAAPAAAAHPYAVYVGEASRRFGLPETWIWAVMRAESGGNSRAVSSAGAMGLMQIMPATWAALTARHGLGDDPFDVRANILAGTAYLRAMLDRYGDPAAALAAYNAGPGRVDDWRSNGRALPVETVAYVARIVPSLSKSAPIGSAMEPPSWRDAILFPARGNGSSQRTMGAATPVIAGASPPSAEASPQPQQDKTVRPASLFVPLSGRLGQ